jgi:hypothetical protein
MEIFLDSVGSNEIEERLNKLESSDVVGTELLSISFDFAIPR